MVWPMSAATAMRLVPASAAPKALATVIAAPLGSYLESMVGWQGVFFALVPIALIVLVRQWSSLPSMNAYASTNQSKNVFTLLKRRKVAVSMAASALFFIEKFALFTYVRPFLETMEHIGINTLSFILLIIGVRALLILDSLASHSEGIVAGAFCGAANIIEGI